MSERIKHKFHKNQAATLIMSSNSELDLALSSLRAGDTFEILGKKYAVTAIHLDLMSGPGTAVIHPVDESPDAEKV